MKTLIKIVMAIILIGVAYPVMAYKKHKVNKGDNLTTALENEKDERDRMMRTQERDIDVEMGNEDKVIKLKWTYKKDTIIRSKDTIKIYRRLGKRIGELAIRGGIFNVMDGFIYPGIGEGETFEIINKIIDNKSSYLNNLRKYYSEEVVEFMDYNIDVAKELGKLKYKEMGNDAISEYFKNFNFEYPLLIYLFYKKNIAPAKFVQSIINFQKVHHKYRRSIFDSIAFSKYGYGGTITVDNWFSYTNEYIYKQIIYQKVLGPKLGKEMNVNFIQTTEIKEGKLYQVSAENLKKENLRLLWPCSDYEGLYDTYQPFKYIIPIKVKILYPDSLYCIIAFSSSISDVPFWDHGYLSHNFGCYSVIIAKKDSGGNFLFNEIYLENEKNLMYAKNMSKDKPPLKNLLYNQWPIKHLNNFDNIDYNMGFGSDRIYKSILVSMKRAIVDKEDEEDIKKEISILNKQLTQTIQEKKMKTRKGKGKNYKEDKIPIVNKKTHPGVILN